MTELSPEILMAYVDNELDEERRVEVEAVLARDAQARDLVERFRRSAQVLGEGLDEVLREPVPQRLVDAARGEGRGAGVVALRPAAPKPLAEHWPGLAAAASVILTAGVLVGAWLFGGAEDPVDVLAADPLQRALENRPSGAVLVFGEGSGQVVPMLTFRAADGRPCREFEREIGNSGTFGVACRSAQGRWVTQIEMQRQLLTSDASVEHYVPAAGAGDPLSDVLDRLGASAALTPQEEAVLLSTGWEATPDTPM